MCSCFGWDKDGDLLAIITDKSPNLVIWDAHNDSGREVFIDTSMFAFIEACLSADFLLNAKNILLAIFI